ncbi:MAG TPA: class I SAM-dependent methyltransferase [Chloroflexota bacterium]|nr:class I SAM-dependent methyltransferase [Chloroflexota bacterium]
MTDFKQIYAHQPAQYERLVAREDVDGNILKALQAIRPLAQADVVEFGAGTGRLTGLLAPWVQSIHAYDESAAMLAVAERKLRTSGAANWYTARSRFGFAVADHRSIPLPDQCADICIEGWAFGHFVGWHPANWREESGRALAEMERLLRPGGVMILLETLGTGFEIPTPPEQLRPFYHWLESEHHFHHTWIRTDYHFANQAEAAELLGFFFGPDMAARAQIRFPECTGIWHKTV